MKSYSQMIWEIKGECEFGLHSNCWLADLNYPIQMRRTRGVSPQMEREESQTEEDKTLLGSQLEKRGWMMMMILMLISSCEVVV